MFQVLDNERPAQYPECAVSSSWKNSKFETFEEAAQYANNWLGVYGPINFMVGVPVKYSGYGDTIEIREV